MDEEISANQEQLAILAQGTEVWNKWREEHPTIKPCLRGAGITGVNLEWANLAGADLSRANLMESSLRFTDFSGANLVGSYFTYANLNYACFAGADLTGAHLRKTILARANFDGAKLDNTDMSESDLMGATLNEASIIGANLVKADLTGAELKSANLAYANLSRALLIDTNLTGARLDNCNVYGISTWGVLLDGAVQSNLVITSGRKNEAIITVDNLKVAQFIYFLLNNPEVRQMINTITSQVVLILGRFAGRREAVLETFKQELRKQSYIPLALDFEESSRPDFAEALRTLANLARFVLIDLTDAGNGLMELVKAIPYCRVPIQPLLLRGYLQYEYKQLLDLKHQYRWVLPLFHYKEISSLQASFQESIIQPAEAKSEELKQRKPVQIFFGYAQEDAGIFHQLEKQLSDLKRSGRITMWDRLQLDAGYETWAEIEKHLYDAHIILLLLSPDFLASNECCDIQEMAMEQHKKGDARVIPVILRMCNWQSTSFGDLQALPRDGKPLVRRNRDGIFYEVANEIADAVKERYEQ